MTTFDSQAYFGFDIRTVSAAPLERLRDGLTALSGYDAARDAAVAAIDQELTEREKLVAGLHDGR